MFLSFVLEFYFLDIMLKISNERYIEDKYETFSDDF